MLNFGFKKSKGVLIDETGSPLNDHPDWVQIYGAKPDHFGWRDFGNEIIFYPRTTSADAENLRFKGIHNTKGILSANYTNTGGTENWTLPFTKMVNKNNMIGARINSNTIEIVQRRNGLWSTIKSGGTNIEGHWEVLITENKIAVYVDGTLELEATHQIADDGSFGISGHKWTTGEATVLTDYNFKRVDNWVLYNGEVVTINGEPITYEGDGMAREIFEILTYDNQVVEGVDITTDDPDWTEVNHFTTPMREAGKYKVTFSIIWKLATVNKSGMVRYSVDGGTTWKTFQSEPKDKTNDNADLFGKTVTTTAAQAFDIRLDMTKESGTASMDCSFCEITVQRVE